MRGLSGKTRREKILRALAGGFAMVLVALAGVQAASAQGTIIGLNPSSVPAGSAGFNLVVTVLNLPVAVTYEVFWGATSLPATVNGNQLTVTVTPDLVALPGTASLYVEADTDVPLFTASVTFTILGPVIASLSPPGVVAGSSTFTLTIDGSGFVSYLGEFPYIYFGTTYLNATYIGSTQLQASIPASLVASAEVVNVVVVDPDPLVSTSPSFPFTIGTALQLLSQAMPGGVAGTFYDFTFQTANGIPPLNFAATGLPGALTLNPATGEVSGTPPAVATYHVSLQVTDSGGGSVTGQFVLYVGPKLIPPLLFSTGSLPPGQVGVPYMTVVAAMGGVPPYTFSLAAGTPAAPGGTLTAGLTIDGGGVIGGTPTTMGTSHFTLQVTDSAGTIATQGFSLTIAPPPLTITTAPLSNAPAGTPLTIVFSATGGYPGYTFSSDPSIPYGMTFGSSGTLTGTPTTPGTYKFSVTVKDSSGATASKAFSIVITPPALAILTASLPNGQVGVAYSAQFYAANGQPPYTWTATGTPAGIAMSGAGSLSGTPTADGAFTVAVTATDSTVNPAPNQAKQTYTLTIAPAPLVISTVALPQGVAGTAYSATLAATGGDIPYTWTVQGLPAGITASPSGVLTGTPASAGSGTVTATVTDSKGATATQRFNLTVTAAPISIATKSLPSGAVQTPYSVTLTAAGGAGSNKWSATGLPAGLTMSASGTISGTPTAAGVSVVAVTVTDAAGTVAVATFTLTIAPAPLTILRLPLPLGVAGLPYSVTMAATGGVAPYQWSATGLPTGFTMSTSGTLSGTFPAPGSFTAAVTVTDAAGGQANQPFTFNFALAPLTIATATLPGGVVGVAYSATLVATGGAGSNQWSASGLPAGLTMSAGGTISGTPTAPGVSAVAVTVTDAAGSTSAATLTLSVAMPATPPLNFSNLPATAIPGTQSGVQVGLASAYPLPVTVTLTLVFAPDSGADDPAVQFSTGGRSLTIQIPAGVTTLVGSGALQMGTVAGTIAITAQLTAAGRDITPSPAPQRTVRIPPAAPVITSVTAVSNSSGFTVTVVGFATPRQVTQASFQFAAAPGANLQTGSLTIPVTSLFSAWYASAAAAPYGSQFSFVQPFAVTGSAQSIALVTVTLTNDQGTSVAVTANLQ
jgi:hypothetical protein